MKNNNATLPAPLMALATATSLYRIQIDGNALAPRYLHEDIVVICPAMNALPESIPAGCVVLVALATEGMPNHFQRIGLFVLNADGDLAAGQTTIERGQYIVLGVVEE
jgi:hypothetical protein